MNKERIPQGLKEQGSAFWVKANTETVFEDSHDLERLAMACRCLDEIRQGEDAISQDGMFLPDRYGSIKEHPAVKVIRDNRILFCRIIRELGLDLSTPTESRLPRQY